MDVRIIFLTAQPPLPLAPIFPLLKAELGQVLPTTCHSRVSHKRLSVPLKPEKNVRMCLSEQVGQAYTDTLLCGASACSRFHTLSSLFFFLLKAELGQVQPTTCRSRVSHKRLSAPPQPEKNIRMCLSERVGQAYTGILLFVGLRLVHAFRRVSKGYAVCVFMQFRILEMFHSICLLLRLPPFCDFQTTHQVVILVRLQR